MPVTHSKSYGSGPDKVTGADWDDPHDLTGLTASEIAVAVREVLLSGLSTSTASAVLDTDTLLAALGKIQAQITAGSTATPIGHLLHGYWTTAPDGYLLAAGGTFGNASSGGTARANDDTIDLFNLFWANGTNTTIPIQTSTGAASTRGASAAADWAANKRMTLPDVQDDFIRGASATNVLGVRFTDTFRDHTHSEPVTGSAGGTTNPRFTYIANDGQPALNTGFASTGAGTETKPRGISLTAAWKYKHVAPVEVFAGTLGIPQGGTNANSAAAALANLGGAALAIFAGIRGSSGAHDFPSADGGRPLQIRWGTGTTNATPTTGTVHNFAAAFTTACRGVILQNTSTSTSGLTLYALPASVSGFTSAASVASINFFYIAIGD